MVVKLVNLKVDSKVGSRDVLLVEMKGWKKEMRLAAQKGDS